MSVYAKYDNAITAAIPSSRFEYNLLVFTLVLTSHPLLADVCHFPPCKAPQKPGLPPQAGLQPPPKPADSLGGLQIISM